MKIYKGESSILKIQGKNDGDSFNKNPVDPTKIDLIDEYISGCAEKIQPILRELRKVISEEAPDALEKISYKMPTYYLKGNLVHFAVQSKHIGFYPAPSGIEDFRDELKEYKTSKGAVQFPLDRSLPLELIRKIVRFRVKENLGG